MKPVVKRQRDTVSQPRTDRPRATVQRQGSGAGAGGGHPGNKASLPSKPCMACGRPMTWRRRWARDWHEVKYCCDACRRAGVRHD